MTTLRVLENWWSPALVRAVGYALLHSLWQGAALAGLLAAALPLLRRARPELRYAASAAALAGLLLAAGGTFGYYYAHPPTRQEQRLSGLSPRAQVVLARLESFRSRQPVPAPTLLPALVRSCEPCLPVLVAAWLLGLLLMGGRLAGGLLLVGRLRRGAVRAAGEGWQRRLAALAARAGLRHPVALLESGSVRGPLVLGHLRPAILLPLGAVAGLPPAQLEALLAHELAHIVRYDYLLGLALAAVEVLFFYHPAVWFMAACLRAEREHCCDDRAAELVGGNRLLVAQALAALAELEAAAPAAPRLALAATGGGRASLLARVRRLALGQNQAPTLRERLAAGLLCLLGIAGLGASLAVAAPARAQTPASTAPTDTVRKASPQLPPGSILPPAGRQFDLVPRAGAPGEYDTLRRRVRARVEARPFDPAPRRPASTIVLEKDKKGRLKSLTVDGQPVPTGEPDKKAKRSKKGETVTIIEAPRPGGWGTNRGSFGTPDGGSYGADVATEAQRQARQSLQDALQDAQLSAGQRQQLAQSLRQLDATVAPPDTRPYQLLPVPRTYAFRFPQLQRGWSSQQPGSFGPADQLQLQQSARELARQSEQFGWRSRQTQRELAQAQRELQRAQQNLRQRLPLSLRLHGEALQGLTESQRQLDEATQRLRREAGTAQRRAQLEARIAAAQAELDALEDQEDVSAAREVGPRQPKLPQTPKLPRTPKLPPLPPLPPLPAAPAQEARPVPPPPLPSSAELRTELRRDGLIGPNDHNFSMQLNEQEMRVNGRVLSAGQAEKYRQLYHLPAGSTGKGRRTVSISINE